MESAVIESTAMESDVMRRGRLRWFGHVERMDESSEVRGVRNLNVDGPFCRRGTKKTWGGVIENDLREKRLNRITAQDRSAWRAAIR